MSTQTIEPEQTTAEPTSAWSPGYRGAIADWIGHAQSIERLEEALASERQEEQESLERILAGHSGEARNELSDLLVGAPTEALNRLSLAALGMMHGEEDMDRLNGLHDHRVFAHLEIQNRLLFEEKAIDASHITVANFDRTGPGTFQGVDKHFAGLVGDLPGFTSHFETFSDIRKRMILAVADLIDGEAAPGDCSERSNSTHGLAIIFAAADCLADPCETALETAPEAIREVLCSGELDSELYCALKGIRESPQALSDLMSAVAEAVYDQESMDWCQGLLPDTTGWEPNTVEAV